MIEVRNLSKCYGNNVAIENLTFSVNENSVYGFLGPNGAGKSTTMNILTGCLAATDGSISIDGFDIVENSVEAKSRIGYLPEHPPLFTDMTPEEYLYFVAKVKKITKSDIKHEVEKVMQETGIYNVRNRLIKNLSKGYAQRVGIAQAILGNPPIIILDEPTVGLDPEQIIEIRALIKELGKEHTVILSSHILSEIQSICDEIIIISNGKLILQEKSENLLEKYKESSVLEITSGTDANTASDILGNIQGVISSEVFETEEGGSDCKLAVEDKSVAEDVFFAFADKRIPLTKIIFKELSLEDIYIKLTAQNNTIISEKEEEK